MTFILQWPRGRVLWRFLKLTIREPRRASPPIQTHISAHRRDAKHRNSVLSAVSFPSSHKLERVPETCTSLPTAAKAELIHRRVGHSGLCSFFLPPHPVLAVCCGLVLTRCWAASCGMVSVWAGRGRQTSERLREVLPRGSFVAGKCLCCFAIEKRR